MRSLFAAIAFLMLSTAAFAQPRPATGEGGPPPPGDRERGGPPERRDGPPDRGPGGRGPGERGPGERGPGDRMAGPGMMGHGDDRPDPRMAKLQMLRGYFEVVDSYARLARDPANSGIAAVVSAADILRPRGSDAAIEYFNKLLPEVKNPAVARAIRIQLVDFYRQAGKHDEALTLLKQLMTADTTGEPAATTPPKQ